MHSSRMCTGRSFNRMPQSASRGGGGAWAGGCLVRGGCLVGGGLLRGGLLGGGGVIPACTEADTPPPCGQTDACKNITFAQLRCGR